MWNKNEKINVAQLDIREIFTRTVLSGITGCTLTTTILPGVLPLDRYTVQQVVINSENRCVQFSTPKEVYRLDDKFYEVGEDNCHDHSPSLKVCR